MSLRKYIKSRFEKYKKLNPTRKISVSSVILVSFLSQTVIILSSIAIFNTFDLINYAMIPAGFVDINYDTSSQEEMLVQIPYEINNKGIYSFTNINLEITLKVRYIDDLIKENITLNFFFKKDYLGICLPGILAGIFEGDHTNYNISAVDQFLNNYDQSKSFWIYGDIELSGNYFMDLIKLNIKISDLLLI